MARGKKKDKKKEEVPSMASLSLSDSQPSTSQQQQPLHGEGLELPSSERRNKSKIEKNEPVSMEVTESVLTEKQSSEAAKPEGSTLTPIDPHTHKRKESKDDEEEADGLGLGLGGGKKNRRKKKKPEHTVPVTSVPQTTAQIVPQTTAQIVPQTVPHIVPQTVPQIVSQTVQHTQTQKLVSTVSTEQLNPALSKSPWGQSKPVVMPSSSSESMPMPQKSMPHMPSQPGSSGEPVQGKGRGRGRGYTTSAPTGPSRDVTKPAEYQVSTPICLFKIPDKVLGRSVPCRQIKVLANYLEMTIQPLKIHRYDIIFKPEKPKKFITAAYALAVKKCFGKIPMAFDQRKNVYTLTALPGVPVNERFKCDVVVRDTNERSITYEVSFKFTGIVDLNTIIMYMRTGGTSLSPPTEAIQAVDVILRQGTLESFVKAGRQYFRRPSNPLDLGDGLEMWTGLFQSAIFASRPFVNIDVAHKGFPRHQLLIDAYSRDFRLDTSRTIEEQRGRGVDAFIQFLKGLKVTAYIGGDVKKGIQREFICNELVDSPRKMFFKMNEGTPQETKCSVMEYFEKEKNCRIRYPNVNCLWVGPKDKRIYYPMEFLLVSYGQVCNKQLNDMQLSTLVRESATPPHDRKRKIEEVIANMDYSRSEFFKKFGLEISNQFVNVDAKVLQPPKIEVGGASVEPRRGTWQSKRLLKPQALENWGLISVDTDPKNSFDSVINMIIGIGNEMGMHIKSPKMVSFNIRINELMRNLQMFKDKGIIFLFVIISARGRDYYQRLKRTAERDVGILTQCIKEFTATRKLNEQTIRNIMLKVNSKMMGINHALDSRSVPMCLQQGKIMLVGADVTHPSPDQSSVPSIAAVTASIDTKFSIYNITLSVQTPKKEMIVDFEGMMVEHLNEFEKRQKELPTKIFVFRDGVSEGQFAQVMNSELQAVHNAYKRKTGPTSTKRPEVLFLLVQKRHHTRFFLGNSANNVEPGTVVDSYIVHPKELDFYLVSHQAIKGTARPTRYHAVCNDGRIAQDEVEQLTYYLCHLYARCTRSVSYPTPTYYAHLACMRARSLIFGDRFSNAELERSPQRLRVLERILETSKMFFV